MPLAISNMMKVSDLELMVPNAANPLGSLSFKIEMVVSPEEVVGDIVPSEEKDVEFSEETTAILNQLRASIINDLQR